MQGEEEEAEVPSAVAAAYSVLLAEGFSKNAAVVAANTNAFAVLGKGLKKIYIFWSRNEMS